MDGFQKRGDLGPGLEIKNMRLQVMPDPDGKGLINPSQEIWLNPIQTVESLCVLLIFLNHTFEMRSRNGEEKQALAELYYVLTSVQRLYTDSLL